LWRKPGGRAFATAGIVLVLALASTHVDAAATAAPETPTVDPSSLTAPRLWTAAELERRPAQPLEVAAPLLALATGGPPPREVVIEFVRATFPEDPDTAEQIVRCESGAGQHPRTYDLEASHAGPMQLARSVWEPYFEAHYGWSWETVVTYLPVHMRAARIVWERGSWAAWECA
jgi:hypothetical protein